MKKTTLSHIVALAFLGGFASTIHANQVDFSGNFGTSNQIDNFTFNVGSTGSVNLYTFSDFPVDPLLTLWKQAGGDWQLVSSNDDRVGANFNETVNSFDAKIVQSLAPGNYDISVTVSGNTHVSNLLSGGFNLQGAPLFDTNNPYQLSVVGDVSSGLSAVPVPGAAWLMGSAIVGLVGFKQRKQAAKV